MARKYLTNIDLGLNQLLNALLHLLGSDPGSPAEGQIWYNSGSHNIKYYNGTAVQTVGTSTATGTVTTVSVASANGFAGTVATATTTPAITITTSVSGLLKGNGTAVSAATSGTDFAPATSGSSILKGNSSGGFSSATSGSDYAPATSGTSLLKGSGSGGFSNAVSNTDYAPPNNATFTGTLTVPTTVNATDAAQKQYVDGVAQGLPNKYSARAATTGSETFTIVSGSVTQISGTTLDTVSPAVNDYLLVKDAPASSGAGSAGSSEPANGLYLVTGNTTNLSLSRAADMSGSNGPAGSYVFVDGGSQANNGFAVSAPSTNSGFTYGTNNIQWVQFSGAGEITPGTGLSKSGNTISLSTPVAAANGGAGTVSGILKANGFGTVSSAKYTTTIGDGSSTSITVTHSLGTRDVIVQIYDATTYVQYECDVTRTSTSVVTLGFTTAPASSSINVVVIG